MRNLTKAIATLGLTGALGGAAMIATAAPSVADPSAAHSASSSAYISACPADYEWPGNTCVTG